MNNGIRPKIKSLAVDCPLGNSGTLDRESQFIFNYGRGRAAHEISLAMPRRSQSYASTPPHPIFAMNLPEGSLLHTIQTRLGKQFAKLDEMALLSIIGQDQIGRITLREHASTSTGQAAKLGLSEILAAQASDGLFEYLLETYLASGISGVQPKVMIPDGDRDSPIGERHTSRTADLIIKSSSAGHPSLTENEFTCMEAARIAGLNTPRFWLSNDSSLFIVERFDKLADGQRLGFEDMAVLAGKDYHPNGNYKYEGNYEGIVKIINALTGANSLQSTQQFFEYFALSCLVRNGDAHLKNFALTYNDPSDRASIKLSPLYDVVTTWAYTYSDAASDRDKVDRTLALSLNKTKSFPSRKELIEFGTRCNVLRPEQVIDRISEAMGQALRETKDRFRDHRFYDSMHGIWDESRSWYEPDRVYVQRQLPTPQPPKPTTDQLLERSHALASQALGDSDSTSSFIQATGLHPNDFIQLYESGRYQPLIESIHAASAANDALSKVKAASVAAPAPAAPTGKQEKKKPGPAQSAGPGLDM